MKCSTTGCRPARISSRVSDARTGSVQPRSVARSAFQDLAGGSGEQTARKPDAAEDAGDTHKDIPAVIYRECRGEAARVTRPVLRPRARLEHGGHLTGAGVDGADRAVRQLGFVEDAVPVRGEPRGSVESGRLGQPVEVADPSRRSGEGGHLPGG